MGATFCRVKSAGRCYAETSYVRKTFVKHNPQNPVFSRFQQVDFWSKLRSTNIFALRISRRCSSTQDSETAELSPSKLRSGMPFGQGASHPGMREAQERFRFRRTAPRVRMLRRQLQLMRRGLWNARNFADQFTTVL